MKTTLLFTQLLFVVGPVWSLLKITVGVMHVVNNTNVEPQIGYYGCAAALDMAMERVKREQLDYGIETSFVTVFDNCKEHRSMGRAADLFTFNNVSTIIGPTCNRPAIAVSNLATFYNLPIYTWGLVTNSQIIGQERYPVTMTTSVTSDKLALAIYRTIQNYGWRNVALVTQMTDLCVYVKQDFEKLTEAPNSTVTIIINIQIVDFTPKTVKLQLQTIKTRARIIVTCFQREDDRRAFFLAAFDEKMTNNEYVYIPSGSSGYFQMDLHSNMIPIWEDANVTDGRNADVKEAMMKTLLIIPKTLNTAASQNFRKEVIDRMKRPPYNCGTQCDGVKHAAELADQLYDTTYLYFLALNESLKHGPYDFRDGVKMMGYSQQTFDGMGGRVSMDQNGMRCPELSVVTSGDNDSTLILADINFCLNNMNFSFRKIADSIVWDDWGGVKPLDTPRCGFTGDKCPVNFFRDYLWVVLAVAGVLLVAILAMLYVFYQTYKHKIEEEARLNMSWLINFISLEKIEQKEGAQSSRSLQSGPSISTKLTMETKSETDKYLFYRLDQDMVAAEKHYHRAHLDKEDIIYLRKMREVDHENVNRFIGLCLDYTNYLSCWRYCSRGSIKDVITKSSINFDGFLVFCLIKDIINGLEYIHKSFMKFHGRLTSSSILVNDRWQIKISDFGMPFMRNIEPRTEYVQLHTAPEILRDPMNHGTPEGDIYSMAIIFCGIIARSSAWDLDNRKEDTDEILFMVKKGGRTPFRPELKLHETVEVNPALLALCRDSWDEEPQNRPNTEILVKLIKNMNNGKNENLMDHVFSVMEQYANTLEDEVESRMKELTEEKKKSDILLYRMLPKQVADRLKLGQTIQPETYDCVSIFFSDVVSFTTLASKCTPLQVVTLLNELYTIFDSTIDEHDAYKVETIGDGYLCVSGMPHRNGNQHISAICSMSLSLVSRIVNFRVPHLPSERINIRIGIHSGPCVAGVVGQTMPKYCLFGDSVNTASRMESNGKPGQVHISTEANDLLKKFHPRFKTEIRGEVIVKGKGAVQTYWLLSSG